jgi:hypothetical protein
MRTIILSLMIVMSLTAGAQNLINCTYRFADVGGKPAGNYSGQCRNGKAHGRGKVIYDLGDIREGAFANGVANGHGSYISARGTSYQGEWRNGNMNGQGTKTWADGLSYQGEFRDGLAQGEGTLHKADGSRSKGYFRSNLLWKGWWYGKDGASCEIYDFRPIKSDCLN